jgi:hypothetical protein
MLGHGEPIKVKQGERVLFHILNGSATEIRSLALPGHSFEVVNLDGNPVPNPTSVPVLWLGTAERISIDICVALYSTKIVTFSENGFWGTLHEARTDVSMLLGLIFFLIVGGGTLALDARYPEGLDPKS